MKVNVAVAIACLLLFLATLSGSAFLADPWWLRSLWCTPVFGVLALGGILLCLLSLFTGEHFRDFAAVLGLILGLIAICYVELSDTASLFTNALASNRPPLDNISHKLLGLGALGLSLTAIWFGLCSIKARAILYRALSIAAIALGVYVFALIPAVFQVAFPAPWQCASVILVAEIFVLVPKKQSSMN